VVPELLARRVADLARLAIVEPPFGDVDIVEAVWWHPTREADPGHRWLLGLIQGLYGEAAGDGAPCQVSPAAISATD
jgi:hypothetical protein